MKVTDRPDITLPPASLIQSSAAYYQASTALKIEVGALKNRRVRSIMSSHANLLQIKRESSGPLAPHDVAGIEAMTSEHKRYGEEELALISRICSYDFSSMSRGEVEAVIDLESDRRDKLKSELEETAIDTDLYKHKKKLSDHLGEWLKVQEREHDAAVEALTKDTDSGKFAAKTATIIALQALSLSGSARPGEGLQPPHAPNPKQLVQTVREGVLKEQPGILQAADAADARIKMNEQLQNHDLYYREVQALIMAAFQDATSVDLAPSIDTRDHQIKEIVDNLALAAQKMKYENVDRFVELTRTDQEQFAGLIIRRFILEFDTICTDSTDLQNKLESCLKLLDPSLLANCGPMPTALSCLKTFKEKIVPLIVLRQELALLTALIRACDSEDDADQLSDLEAEANSLVNDCGIYRNKKEITKLNPHWLSDHAFDLHRQARTAVADKDKKLREVRTNG